jgi:hypothetical protein
MVTFNFLLWGFFYAKLIEIYALFLLHFLRLLIDFGMFHAY